MTPPSGFQPFGPVAAGFLAAIASCLFGTDARPAEPAWSPIALMPRAADYTHMWWAEGFPAHTPSAPWRRCIQTGYYAMVLDTPTLSIPHLGPVPAGLDYLACARADNQIWQALPPAELMLTITANGKCYRGTAGGPWSDFRGPRLIESGRFVQRADVTDLVFTAEDGQRLNVDARLETIAWPDRLALILAARPAHAPIPAGDVCFGRLGGGFGLDGTNHLEIPHAPELDCEQFTLEFWVFLPANYQVSQRTPPWLVCKNQNEEAEGNYGIVLLGGTPRAVINIGGGRDNQFFVDAQRGRALQIDTWNHVAISYDGNTLRLFVNGDTAGEKWIGRPRVSGHEGLAFGRRQDNCGDGYYFRGAVDEIRLYDQALPPAELRQRVLHPELEQASVAPVRQWSFAADGRAVLSQPRESWSSASLDVRLAAVEGNYEARSELPAGEMWTGAEWREVSVVLQYGSPTSTSMAAPVTVQASEVPAGTARPVDFDAARGWHRVNLDGIEPTVPEGGPERQNDAIERVRLTLTNPDAAEHVVRLLFEKCDGGFRQRFGSPITGISAILRDAEGQPTGIPVQLSKNWHARPEGGTYAGTWFHGFSQVRLPPQTSVELELTLAYGHWGGVAAASHAQLCLIGWGSNQLWDQSALGSWGESICYEPDQAQAHAAVLDVRPVMVGSMNRGAPWSWTHNVGGGDFFRTFDADGDRVFPARMRTAYLRHGPCLTEVTYAGHTAEVIEHSATVSLSRTDDIVRGVYRLRMDVTQPLDVSRFVIFQVGADTYGYTAERRMAVGNETGLVREWATQWGGDTYRTDPLECTGRVPWISLHDAVSRAPPEQGGAWANRGVVIRAWEARLGGVLARPWVAERGVQASGEDTSTIDILPPPGVHRLEPGDFVEAVIEHVVMPQYADDYYGPNEGLRAALGQHENTWHMIHREAVGNDLQVQMTVGALESLRPAVRIRAADNRAEFTLLGGVGYVPVTFTNLSAPRDFALYVDNELVDQSTHGNDFWQTDFDPQEGTWQITFTIPAGGGQPQKWTLQHGAQGEAMSELEQVRRLRATETAAAYDACPYAFLSKNYFTRFVRDPAAAPTSREVDLQAGWTIVVPSDAQLLTTTMADELREFLATRMEVCLPIEKAPRADLPHHIHQAIVLLDEGGGDPTMAESFTLSIDSQRVVVRGHDAAGLRDGVVKLVDTIGMRQAPFLPRGEQVYTPRVAVRLGVVPWMGTFRDLVFLGYNAVLLNTYFEGEESLFALSVSDAIPELVNRRRPAVRQSLIEVTREAKRYGVKTYCQVNTRQKFPGDDPVFAAHPEVRGALTWKADGEYVLCTEHPLVQRYLAETVEELFRSAGLDGLLLINGGESFYHCFMRAFGTAKGHTNCPRCEPLGAEAVVANLSNHLLAAARQVHPRAEIIAWPYSAEHVWSADRYQFGLIERLHPGAGILTEIEKDETLAKSDGVVKHIGDYSIDLIGPGERATRQVAACRAAGVPIHIKSEPELGFEAPRLPFIPCLDRWAARAQALASCQPDGVWVFPYFRPNYGSSAAEVFKSYWWEPTPNTEEVLLHLASRAAGHEAGPHLRAAWRHVSQAIAWSPELPAYYTGPYYIGPAHPMCVSLSAELPEVFYGQFLFMAEATDAEGLARRPIFVTSPTGNGPVFGKFYRQMEACLREAVLELDAAQRCVPERHRLTFQAECSPIRWFYHTARTQANFYESCMLREALQMRIERPDLEKMDIDQCHAMLERWKQVLLDEQANTQDALPIVEADMRLDCYYGIDHAFPHAADMIRAKLQLLQHEIFVVLPGIGRRWGLESR